MLPKLIHWSKKLYPMGKVIWICAVVLAIGSMVWILTHPSRNRYEPAMVFAADSERVCHKMDAHA
jgi:hypothetical protein